MTNSLLIRTFKQLSSKDLRDLCAFVRCNCFNHRDDVALLCEYLAGHIGKPSLKAFEPERMCAAACPGQPFDLKKLRHVMSYLLEVVRQYLAWSECRSDTAGQQQYLIRALRNRGLDKLFEKEWQRADGTAEESPSRDAKYHFSRYQLHQEKLERAARRERSAKLNLQPLPDELTAFYLSEMLRHACSALMHQAVAGQAYRIDLLNVILETAGQDAMLQIPAVAVYYYAYQMLQSPDAAEPFERLKGLLNEHENRFAPEEMRGLYLMAINGCIRRMNAGQRAYVREAFDLYKAALERDFLRENGVLSGFTYKNIIRVGVALGEHEWTARFLETHRGELHPRERDNLYYYNLAYLRFQQRDYAGAMPLLQQVDLEDPLNNLDARRMLLRSYYELGEWDALESLLQSFSAYLRRQKNLGYHRLKNEKLIVFTKKLMETNRSDLQAVAALRAEIDATPDVTERAWLLEQAGG
ncbi:MAG: tetratricopeptide repeat protein [Saprospiraceae bacterium]|nr:tetratricopeptide repeat protein [Saprospiraceae bacterium]